MSRPLIRRLSLLGGACGVQGLAVVIDVFRAGSFACRALSMGASRIVPAATLEEARALRSANPGWLLAGERNGIPPSDFDTGNSPHLLGSMSLRGRILIHATSAGTKGAVLASRTAEAVCMACFANAGAAARFVLSSGHPVVSLLAMGDEGERPAPEDEIFAEYFERVLSGVHETADCYTGRIRDSGATGRFLESRSRFMPVQDLEECLTPDRYPSVPVLETSDGFPPSFVEASRPGQADPSRPGRSYGAAPGK